MSPLAQTQLIIDWITGLGWDTTQEIGYPLLPGPNILNEPDQAVFITGSGGPGYITDEGSVDASTWQARLRGPSDDPLAAEAAAQLLDNLILRAPFPATVDGVTINLVYRLGSGPSPLPADPSDLRYEFTANYVIVTGA
jgi:hypothetical protein